MQNTYLILYRCTFDDMPVSAHLDKQTAMNVAMGLGNSPPEEPQQVLGVNPSSPCNVSIITFVNGRPARVETVKDFT